MKKNPLTPAKYRGILRFNLVLALSLWATFLCAQNTDIFRAEYLLIPENETGIRTARYKLSINLPFKVGKQDYLIAGGEYNAFDVDTQNPLPFDNSQLENFHVIDLNIGYITKWNENWRLVGIVTPRIASNLDNRITMEDIFFNATATFWKEKSDAPKPFRILVGLTFNSTTGLPIPLPLISYKKQFHPKWSFNVGIPKMNFSYLPSENHSIQASFLLDGYFVNLQNDIVLPDGQLGSRLSFTALIAGLEYRYRFTQQSSLYFVAGRSLIQEARIRDEKRNNVYILNSQPNFYLKAGYKISIF